MHVADRLIAAIEDKQAPVCVGLDPVLGRMPDPICRAGGPLEQFERFTFGVLDAVAPYVPAVKFQSACYERYGSGGVGVLNEAITHARRLGLLIILDGKRADISQSAEHYAAAAFDAVAQDGHPDLLTVNPYLGSDGVFPFIRERSDGRSVGAFVLVRTSNPSGDAIQAARMASGLTVADHIATCVAEWGRQSVGIRGYSAMGAVVGATKASQARTLRKLMPQQIFLVPGYGAQGGSADDARVMFNDDGLGAIITASRSVIYAQPKPDEKWDEAVARGAREFAETLRGIVQRVKSEPTATTEPPEPCDIASIPQIIAESHESTVTS